MSGAESDDERLRSAFESFRADALGAVDPPGATAVRAAARHRQRARVAVSGTAAGLVLVAAVGTGLLFTRGLPGSPPSTTAAASQSAEHTVRPTPPPRSPTVDAGLGNPGVDAGSPSSTAVAWNIRVAVGTQGTPVRQQTDHYSGALTVTVHNDGDRTIPHTTVRLTVPEAVSFRGSGDTGDCRENTTCLLGSVDDLRPGEQNTFGGMLRYPVLDPDHAHRSAPPAGSIDVRATDSDGTALADSQQRFTVPVEPGDGSPSSPTGSAPSDSESPSPTPSLPSTSDNDARRRTG